MVADLDTSLKAILTATDAPIVLRDAEVAFERPSDSYNPDKTTLNLFLYDVRESLELRSSEPVIERQDGVAIIRRAPLRLVCSYLATAWIEAGVTGEAAVLAQHRLLGEALRVFAGTPSIPEKLLQGELADQPYPIPLTVGQGDLTRNPAEFWSALGGRLRPSFTLTAVVAMDVEHVPLTAPQVSTRVLDIRLRDGEPMDVSYRIGGTVRHSASSVPLPGVTIALPASGRATETDADGRFVFSGLVSGTFDLVAARAGFATVNRSIRVPGTTPTTFDMQLSPNP